MIYIVALAIISSLALSIALCRSRARIEMMKDQIRDAERSAETAMEKCVEHSKTSDYWYGKWCDALQELSVWKPERSSTGQFVRRQ